MGTAPIAEFKPRRRRRKPGVGVPRALRRELRAVGRDLAKRYKDFFLRDRELRDRCAKLLRVLLPPRRAAHHPRDAHITRALRTYRTLRRKHAEQPPREIWHLVCQRTIPGFSLLSETEQSDQCNALRERARSRERSMRRRRAKSRVKLNPTVVKSQF